MNKVLVINSGLHGEQSQSNKLTEAFIKVRTAAGFNEQISIRNLTDDNLPHLSSAEMQAWMTPERERTEQQKELAKLSDKLIAELLDHDLLVIGMPMYNLGVPSTFKAYIDRIARAGKTFKYTENGPQGLVSNTKVIVLAARGGQYQGTELDSQTGHIKAVFGLMGIADIEFIYAEGLNMGEEQASKALAEAKAEMQAMV